MRPFFSYVGSKNKVVENILSQFPTDFLNYYEPFVGGGSVFWGLPVVKNKNYFLSDLNDSLINTYKIVQENVKELIRELSKKKYKREATVFYNLRDRFNKIKFDGPLVEKAALFIYLTKCGFSCMYRENLSGLYDIPFGRASTTFNFDKKALLDAHERLKGNTVSVCHLDYTKIRPKKGDLVYLDPPYDESYNQYIKERFTKESQEKLKEFVDKLTEKGVYVVVSNSDTSFIRNLYKSYIITSFAVNCTLGSSKQRKEVVIKNFTCCS